MNEEQLRQDICSVGRMLYERGLVAGTDGNISVRTSGGILVTPSGVNKGALKPHMLVQCGADGFVAADDASARHPSSEIQMHAFVYKQRSDVGAVVHAHPVCATAFAACRRALDAAYLPELVVGFGCVPVCSFALPSTAEVPASIQPYVRNYNAVLLANHGVLAWGTNLDEAFNRLESVEHIAKIYSQIEALGGGVELSEDTIEQLLALRASCEALACKRA